MTASVAVVRRDPLFDEGKSLMRFRLHYEGPLLSASGEVRGGQVDRRAPHKHAIRKAFDGQLRHHWDTHPWLKELKFHRSLFGLPEPDVAYDNLPLMRDGLAEMHEVCGRRFVPLVCAQFDLLCGVQLLLLRRDRPGSIFDARDLDNRLKTVFDALKMPKIRADFGDDESTDPMFVLLQDDSLISSVTIETDDLLDPPSEAGRDDSYVRLLITVDIRPYRVSMFNAGFL